MQGLGHVEISVDWGFSGFCAVVILVFLCLQSQLYVILFIIVLLYICQVCQSVIRLFCSVQLYCLPPRGNLCLTIVCYSFSSFLSINQHSYFVCLIRVVCYPSMSSAPIVRTVALHYLVRLLWFRFYIILVWYCAYLLFSPYLCQSLSVFFTVLFYIL